VLDVRWPLVKSLVWVGVLLSVCIVAPHNATSMHTIQLMMRHMLSLFSVMKDLKYADSHEWVKVEGDSTTVGIRDHAQVSTFIYFYCCEFRV
jgi:hypothetical protein